jgi:hypothetical protein
MAVAGQHGQPVALPPAAGSDRVEPDRPADGLVRPADDVDRRRIVVMDVGVVAAGPAASAAEQALLDDEDLVPDPHVRAPFGLGGHGIAGRQRRPPEGAARQASRG